ncbi:MAG TPA: sialidase family protein, partial [Ktedonobacterales bacterium]|nr:sialidase family protein [Ktedonobacterales bacterium]
AAPSLARVSWARDAWRAATVAAAVILIVGSIAALLLNRATVTRIGASTATPTQADSAPTITPAPSATSFPTAPAGWRAILPARRFAEGSGQGFAVSAARPGRLAGCGIPAVSAVAQAYPELAISDDGGQTWKESDIQAAGTVTECSVVVDQLHPDTIIVGNADGSKLAVTTDAGQTWRPLPLPAGMAMNFTQAASSNSLVNGQLIGVFHNISGSGRWELGDLSITGAFKVLDATLSYPTSAMNSPMALAVDPANASHVYVIAQGKRDSAHPTQDVLLFVTSNAGASWRQIHTFPYGERVSLWASTPGAIYLWVSYPEMSANGNPLQVSFDGGVTWRDITSTNLRLDSPYFSPSGQIVLITAGNSQATAALEELNPATGKLTPMGPLPPLAADGFTAVVTGGAHPVFVVASSLATYVRPLP